MATTEALFATLLYRAPLGAGTRNLIKDLGSAIRQLAIDDVAVTTHQKVGLLDYPTTFIHGSDRGKCRELPGHSLVPGRT